MVIARAWREKVRPVIVRRIIAAHLIGCTLHGGAYLLVILGLPAYDGYAARQCYNAVSGPGANYDCMARRLDAVSTLGWLSTIATVVFVACAVIAIALSAYSNRRGTRVWIPADVPVLVLLVGTVVLIAASAGWFVLYHY